MLIIPIVIFLIFLFIFLKLKSVQNPKDHTYKLAISVIVAAKNEEDNIKELITSLKIQNYPNEKFEVVIVDDNSTDSTFNFTQEEILGYSNFSVIKAENKKYEGKRGALQIGIEKSKYDYILITDADCIASDNLLIAYSNKFSANFDFIFGVSPFRQTKSIVNKIACFDNLWVHILSFAFANIGLPYSASARSFGFRKSSFLKINGYKFTTDTLSGDDDLLLREAIKHRNKIGTITEKNAFVYTNSKSSLREFIRQKSRHISTSNYYAPKILFLLGIWHLLNIIMLFSIVLTPIYGNIFILIIIKLLGDVIIIKVLMNKFGYSFKFIEIIHLQILYEFFVITNYLKGSLGKNKW